MIRTIIGIIVTAIMNGAITTECGYPIAKTFAVHAGHNARLATEDKVVQKLV
jgi:hypothetical protein